jgi:hypothetical protein
MHCLSRVRALKSYTGGQKNDGFDQNRNSTPSLCVMEVAMFKVVIGFSIILSFLCMLLAAAPFTPAIGVSFIMLLFAGFIGYKGFLQSSIVLLLINTLAVIGSPGMDISNTDTLIFVLILFPISYGGVLIGVRKLVVRTST